MCNKIAYFKPQLCMCVEYPKVETMKYPIKWHLYKIFWVHHLSRMEMSQRCHVVESDMDQSSWCWTCGISYLDRICTPNTQVVGFEYICNKYQWMILQMQWRLKYDLTLPNLYHKPCVGVSKEPEQNSWAKQSNTKQPTV